MIGEEKVRETIPKVVDRIIRRYRPKRVILFGSYANGRPTKDSDIDILVVADEPPSHGDAYEVRSELLRDFSLPVQLVWISEQEFIETKDVIGGIAYPASKYGEVLYEES